MSKIFPPKRIQNVGPAAKDAVSYLLCRIEKRMEGEPAKKKKKKSEVSVAGNHISRVSKKTHSRLSPRGLTM